MHISQLTETAYLELAEEATFISQLDLGTAMVSQYVCRGEDLVLIATSSGTYGRVSPVHK
jgi:hypothetical protein